VTDHILLRLYRRLRRLLLHIQHVHGPQSFTALLDELCGRERLRSIEVSGVPLYIRTSTPDLYVVESSLLRHEYAEIQLQEPQVIIDAGANIGTSAIAFARRFPRSRVIAIEAEKQNYELMLRNTAPYDNILPVHAALWPVEGERAVLARPGGHWSFTLTETSDSQGTTGQTVPCTSIPQLMAQYELDSIDLLKLDIEGCERELFSHSYDWLDSVKAIAVELHDRVAPGCSRAFYLATADFSDFEIHGEKVIAYREERPH